MQMVEVKLLGELGKRFGRKHRFMANSAKDVFSALSNQLEGFKDYFCNAHEKGIGFKLIDDDPDGMTYENVLMGCRRLIIAPVISKAITIRLYSLLTAIRISLKLNNLPRAAFNGNTCTFVQLCISNEFNFIII
jgi:predicted phage tail protein